MRYLSIGRDDAELFDNLVNTEDAFVKFFSKDCPHCKNMESAWEQLEKNLAPYNVNIIEVHGDATNYIKSSCAKNIPGYPTIMEVKP